QEVACVHKCSTWHCDLRLPESFIPNHQSRHSVAANRKSPGTDEAVNNLFRFEVGLFLSVVPTSRLRAQTLKYSTVTRQRGVHPPNKSVELGHVVTKKILHRIVGDLTVIGDETGCELDVRLDRVHLRRIAETQNASQVLLPNRGSNLSR